MILNGNHTTKEVTMTEFDMEVKRLRGTVEPKTTPKRKADCTPAEWASNLDYQRVQMKKHRRRIKKRQARAAKKSAAVKVPATKPVDGTVSVLLKMAKHLAKGNTAVIEVLTVVEKLV